MDLCTLNPAAPEVSTADMLPPLGPSPELQRLGEEIAKLSAHLDAAAARLLDLIRWNGLLRQLVRHRRAKVALRPQTRWKEEWG